MRSFLPEIEEHRPHPLKKAHIKEYAHIWYTFWGSLSRLTLLVTFVIKPFQRFESTYAHVGIGSTHQLLPFILEQMAPVPLSY